jgi:1,2-diacylglycerol 3-alpha-glucosyltransferase
LSGVVTSIVQLKEGQEQRGHKAILVTVTTPNDNEKDATIYRFPSVPFNSDAGFRLGLVNQRSIDMIVREEQLDIIHTHTEFSIGWAAKRAARAMDLPLIHTAHTIYEEYRHYLFLGNLLSTKMIQRFLKLFLVGYDTLICPSTKAQDYFKSFLPSLRTVVIGNGVCKSRFRPNPVSREERDQRRKALGIQPSDKVILYVGRIAREKRVLELFRVLAPLLQKHPHYKAMFVGCGPSYAQLIRATTENNIHRQAIFPGTIQWEQIHTYYLLADVFVTASLSEVHPMTVIEASMCGLPIVARRDTSYVELIRDSENGYLVDSDRQIAEKLVEILGDEAKLLTMSQNGLILSDQFNAEEHVKKVESLYQQVLVKG